MVGTLTASSRVARGIAGLAVGSAALACAALLFLRAPAAFVLAGTFAAPLAAAALALAARWTYLGLRGRAGRPKPPTRPGRMEPRPLSAAARRRPRS